MASTYPGAIDSVASPSGSLLLPDDGTLVLNLPEVMMNGVHNAVIAVETALGVNPQGASSTVAVRIAATEAVANAAMPGSTSIPAAETQATILSKLGATVVTGSNTGDQTTVTGNAGTATKLATARAINGVPFDGTAAITVADATKVPLTSVGTAAAKDTGITSGTIPLLGAGGVLALARLASGTPDGTKFVADDGTLKTPAGGGGGGPTKGTGMPNGVVTGSPGDEYIDTAATYGASMWLKLTGIGTNTGWVVTFGDTGWREVKTLLAGSWSAASLQVRRFNAGIYWNAQAFAGPTGNAFTTGVPAGFDSVATSAGGYFTSTLQINKTAGGSIYGQLSTITTATIPWPLTLPGTAA